MYDADIQILMEGGTEHLYATCLLAYAHVVRVGSDACAVGVIIGCEQGCKVGVVGDILHAESETGFGAVEGETAFDAGACLLTEVVVPPSGFAVEMAEHERGGDVAERGTSLEADGVATQAEVEVGVAVDVEVACIGTKDPNLGSGVEVQGTALCLE